MVVDNHLVTGVSVGSPVTAVGGFNFSRLSWLSPPPPYFAQLGNSPSPIGEVYDVNPLLQFMKSLKIKSNANFLVFETHGLLPRLMAVAPFNRACVFLIPWSDLVLHAFNGLCAFGKYINKEY